MVSQFVIYMDFIKMVSQKKVKLWKLLYINKQKAYLTNTQTIGYFYSEFYSQFNNLIIQINMKKNKITYNNINSDLPIEINLPSNIYRIQNNKF